MLLHEVVLSLPVVLELAEPSAQPGKREVTRNIKKFYLPLILAKLTARSRR
jgi:hypothetical protein